MVPAHAVNPALREPKSFVKDSEHALLSLLFMAIRKLVPAPEEYIISLFQNSLLYKHPGKDGPEQRQSVLLLVRHAETQETHGDLSPNTNLMEVLHLRTSCISLLGLPRALSSWQI